MDTSRVQKAVHYLSESLSISIHRGNAIITFRPHIQLTVLPRINLTLPLH